MITDSIFSYLKPYFKKILYLMWFKSLVKAIHEQNLKDLVAKLEQIVPDISSQYSRFAVDTPYLKTKVRGLHAFQISLVSKVIGEIKKPVIADIGDSSGTHLQYIMKLYLKNKDIQCLSINLDIKAIERIKAKGLEAIHARIEDLQRYDIDADIFLCFETLEHLMDPCQFLYELSSKTNAEYLIVTVPYLKNSRLGLHHIRGGRNERVYAENTHIFELNPEDWKLVINHAGWRIVSENIYLQYPKKGIFYITKPIWKRLDYEGFYGLILKRDNLWSSKYLDW